MKVLFFLFSFCTSCHIKIVLLTFQEEMEENAETIIYENYKFLTKEELERLNLTNLIGTNLLKAYMHGFFIDYGFYKKVTVKSNMRTSISWLQQLCAHELHLFTIFR